LPGPYALSTYTAAVRAYNQAGPGGAAVTAPVTLGVAPPFAMESVSVTTG
jgi:hypothetical protein